MRWIKASERLPDKKSFWKRNLAYETIGGYGYLKDLHPDAAPNIVWLDETPDTPEPVSGEGNPLNKKCLSVEEYDAALSLHQKYTEEIEGEWRASLDQVAGLLAVIVDQAKELSMRRISAEDDHNLRELARLARLQSVAEPGKLRDALERLLDSIQGRSIINVADAARDAREALASAPINNDLKGKE